MIGLTGVARSGKDTFYSILKKYLEEKGIKSQRLAFADALKNELYDFTKDKFKIDLLDCTPENKEIVRPLMVAYGKCRRIQTEGKYWTSTIQPEVNESKNGMHLVGPAPSKPSELIKLKGNFLYQSGKYFFAGLGISKIFSTSSLDGTKKTFLFILITFHFFKVGKSNCNDSKCFLSKSSCCLFT